MRRFLAYLAGPVASGAIGFVMLPILTAHLDAAHWGRLALATALVQLGGACAGLGAGIVLARHFQGSDANARRSLISTLAASTTAVAAIAGGLVAVLWLVIPGVPLGGLDLALALATMMPTALWTLAVDVTMLDGRVRWYTIGLSAQALCWAAAGATAVHMPEAREHALFIAQASGALALGIAAVMALAPYASRPIRIWLIEIHSTAPRAVGSSLAETGLTAVERSLLTGLVGPAVLGLYVHAQQWRTVAQMLAKAGARSVWPKTLEEARLPGSNYPATRQIWLPLHLALAAAASGMLLAGGEPIAWLTHGVFAGAQWPAGCLLAILLIQNSGRPQIGWLYANGLGNSVSNLTMASAATGAVLLFALVPLLGLGGALTATAVQATALRLGVHRLCRNANLPRQDGPVLVGLAVIASSALAAWLLADRETERRILACGIALGLGVLWTMKRRRKDATQP